MAVQSEDASAVQGKATGVAAVLATTGAVGACVLCCTLPVAFPAATLALLGGGVAFLGVAHKAMTLAGLVTVLAAWGWVWWQSRRTGRRPARATLRLMGLATALLILALAWPLVEGPLLALIR